MQRDLLLALPLSWLFALTVLIVLLSILGGIRLGRRKRSRSEHEREAPVGSAVGAILGLLAFLLAFTFGIAASRFDARKQLLLDEVNAIGTAYLRAGLLPEPECTEVSGLLREYVNIRVEVARQLMQSKKAVRQLEMLKEAIAGSEELQDRIWSQADVLAKADPHSEIIALFISSLNEMIDLHTKRVTVGIQYRIPETIWFALYFVAVMSMFAVGYHFGLSGGGSLQISLVLALTFSAVILLIADLDRGGEGFLKVNQQPLLELHQKLNTPRQ